MTYPIFGIDGFLSHTVAAQLSSNVNEPTNAITLDSRLWVWCLVLATRSTVVYGFQDELVAVYPAL